MYQKDFIRSAWKSAGLYDENDAKLQQFLKMLDDPTQCWSELTDACRSRFAAYKAKVAQPILASSDKLVHLMIIRSTRETMGDEVDLLEQYIASSDPVRDEVELKAIAFKNISRLNDALTKKPNLTNEVRRTLAAQAAATAAPTAASIASPSVPASASGGPAKPAT
jgi:hypothetical protein